MKPTSDMDSEQSIPCLLRCELGYKADYILFVGLKSLCQPGSKIQTG
jgi:hypothetical protein